MPSRRIFGVFSRESTSKDNFSIKLLETQDNVPKKFLKKLSDTKLFEVRIEWISNNYRFLCFFDKGNIVVLTHRFQKKTMKTPKKEIILAEKYRQDYFRRKK